MKKSENGKACGRRKAQASVIHSYLYQEGSFEN